MAVTRMKVLSIRQPWASIIINGYKSYEFRSWKTKFRGRVLIHASKDVETEYLGRFESLGLEYPTSAIIGSVEVTDCVLVTETFEEKLIAENELVYGATRGRAGYGFQVENPVKFEEIIPTNGELGFWEYLEPEEVMDLMHSINYGWMDSDGKLYDCLNKDNCSNYKLLKAKDIIKNGFGICWDQVEVERFYLRNNKINLRTLFMYYDDGIDDESHTFLTYQKSDKFYWFEHAWMEYSGIHEYSDFNDLIQDVKNKFLLKIGNSVVNDRLHCYIYKKPKIGLSIGDFYEFCKQGEEIDL